MCKKVLRSQYLKISNQLPEENPNLKLQNHCYLRIANDIACGEKWSEVVDRPFYKNASTELLLKSLNYLYRMKDNKNLILHYNKISLSFRKSTRTLIK